MEINISALSKDIDREFTQNMRILSKAAATNHPLVRFCMARCMELYIGKKIDMELSNSLKKIFN